VSISSPPSPRASPPPLLSLLAQAHPRCAPPRCRPTFNVQRSTCNSSRLAPLPWPLLPVQAQQRCAPTLPRASPPPLLSLLAQAHPRCAPPRCRPTFNVQRSTCNSSRLAPLPWPLLPVQAQQRCAPPRCRPTFNVQRSTCNSSRLTPLAPSLPITPPSVHSYTHRFACQRTVICVVYYRARFVPASFPGLWQSTLSACTRRTGVHLLQFDWSKAWT
jgi:hypothetical protein